MKDQQPELALLADLGPENDGIGDRLQELVFSTGNYIEKQNPKLYGAVKIALEYGVPIEAISDATGMSRNTVAAIAANAEGLSLEHHKKVILSGLQRLRRGIILRMTSMIESGEKIEARDLAVMFGILSEKEALEQGNPTAIIGYQEDPEVADLRRLLAASRTPQGMGLEARNLPANAQAAPVPMAPPRAAPGIIEAELTGDSITPGHDAATPENTGN